MIGKQHSCKSCKKKAGGKGKRKMDSNAGYKFPPWHPDVLELLPRDLVELFPALILRRSAVDKKLINRIEQTLVSPIEMKTLAGHLGDNHIKHFMNMQIR